MAAPEECWYPAVADLLALHDEIISEYEDSEPGVRDEDQVQFALESIEWGHFGDVPESTHEKAYHLLRLLTANHPFVDGNKRTALNATTVFFAVNGLRFDYGDDVRTMLKLLGIRENLLDASAAVEYLSERTTVEPSGESEDPSRESILRIACQDRDEHRDIYDALADE
jgi:death-on-curing protein